MEAVRRISTVVPRAQGAGSSLLRDLDSFFRRGVDTRVEDTVRRVVDDIDWSAGTIVLWMPGTNQWQVPEAVANELSRHGLRAAYVPYMASWQLQRSLVDGEHVLRAVLAEVARRRRTGQHVILLGESQGGWIASNVLTDPQLAGLVHRTALIAHPGIAANHADGSNGGPRALGAAVREFNNPVDATTTYLGTQVGTRAVGIIDAASNLRIGAALLGALGIVVAHPDALRVVLATQSFRTSGGPSPHAAGSPYADALAWALGRG